MQSSLRFRKTQHINEIPNSSNISIASFEENLMNNQQNLGIQRDPYFSLHFITCPFACYIHSLVRTLSETRKTKEINATPDSN